MIIIGHRGARGLAAENTIASIDAAIDHKVNAVEFDVHVTKDLVPVLNHDDTIVSIDGHKLVIANSSLVELRAQKPDIATLDEVFINVNHRANLMIEIKSSTNIDSIVALTRKFLKNGWTTDELCFCSKNQSTLVALYNSAPEIPRVVIERWSGVKAHFRVRQVHAKGASMNQVWLWWGFVRSVKTSGYELYAYTLNDPKKARRWAKYGLTAVITDFPDRFEE